MTNVEDYIKKNIFGKPQLKPDEKNKFLGNFAERVAIALTVSQVKNPDNVKIVENVMKKYPEYHLYLNGKIDVTEDDKKTLLDKNFLKDIN